MEFDKSPNYGGGIENLLLNTGKGMGPTGDLCPVFTLLKNALS